MNRARRQNGLALFLFAVLIAIGGFVLAELVKAGHLQHRILIQQHARQAQVLEHIRAALFGFAAQQGVHSQSHIGHLPCPANQPDQSPQTTCLNKAWGYLPTHSKTALNYINRGIDARGNELEPSVQHHWHYAVSAQLIQPNELGWSRWVDFRQPSIDVRVPEEDNRIERKVVAVVAHDIQPTGLHQFDITPPYMLIREHELRAHVVDTQIHLIKDTLQAWPAKVPSEIHIAPLPSATGDMRPINANCACRCTKTRCSCNCDTAAKWKSTAACYADNPNCSKHGPNTVCTSNTGEPCIFLGAASMGSDWPVSRFEPVASSNKSCRPANRLTCPLSTGSDPCVCAFSWPDNSINELDRFTIHHTATGYFQVRYNTP